jgi:hypothetical protein
MLARAMGWNEPEKINITATSEIQIRIGGMDVPEQS